jgi:hypothetical protein
VGTILSAPIAIVKIGNLLGQANLFARGSVFVGEGVRAVLPEIHGIDVAGGTGRPWPSVVRQADCDLSKTPLIYD